MGLVLAGLALAGVEPSPFHWLINKLGSVENVLSAVDYKLEKILAVPPEPCTPPDPCKLARKLNTIAGRLNRQNSRVVAVIEDLPEVPPDPCKEALFSVWDKADSIVQTLRVGTPPDPCCGEVREALTAVNDAATAIITNINDVVPRPDLPPDRIPE